MSYPNPRPLITVPSTQRRHRLRGREWPRTPRRDPHSRLITQLLDKAGPDSSVIATSSRPWASATFIGARHVIQLKLGGCDHARRADSLMESLPEMEFAIPGHIVADLCIDEHVIRAGTPAVEDRSVGPASMETILQLSILTIEDW